MGYRYFQKEGTPEVSYPFGYGLSYTSFQESAPVFSDGAVTVTVTNTGAVPGKTVVQVYHPFLCAYGKTRQLQPGESQTLTWQLEGENSK